MDKIREMPFIINGIKSDVHCINLHITNPLDANKGLYHYHDYIELLYSISTNDCVCINEKYHNFTDGDFVIINSEEPHKVLHMGISNYICIKFSPHILYSNNQPLYGFKYAIPFLSENSNKKFFSKDEIADTSVPNLICEIMDEWNKQETGYELVIRGNILKVFAEIFRCKNNSGKIAIPDITLSDTMKQALKYISENYNTASAKLASEACGLSYNHFSRIFKKELRQNFSDYLVFVKLKEAEKFLISTDKSITEIAHCTGFSTSSHFISHFKKYKNITPGQFRKKIRKRDRIN